MTVIMYEDKPADLKHLSDEDICRVEEHFASEIIMAMGLDTDSFDCETWRENFFRYLADLEQQSAQKKSNVTHEVLIMASEAYHEAAGEWPEEYPMQKAVQAVLIMAQPQAVTDEPTIPMLDAGASAYRKNKVLRPTPAMMAKAIWQAMFRAALQDHTTGKE